MLRKQKQISQRVIKEDPLVSNYYNSLSWFEANKKMLTNIGGAVLVLAALGWFYLNNTHTNNEKATTELAKVFSLYDNGQYQVAINGIPEKNISGLQAIVDNYGSTKNGNVAKVYLANAFFNLQEYDKALKLYDDVSTNISLLEVSALSGMAACYEAKGNFSDAAKYFEKAGKKNSADPNAAENLYHAARNYTKSGNKERAVELYKSVQKEYPASTVAREADRFLSELNG